ncbi:hypothetical protein [Aerococcus viridans]|uniref:DUF4352 domain-containing protein n=1 Tax=Aerococcus viridans TaxID=1377 RepID=A0A2J9PKL2_9LACT|nr:hypothetical protein [Aerococcus viridans]PNL90872.1 hypothetical protein A6J77_000750 [Aerococcus viridans]
MKKIVLLGMSVFLLGACGSNTENESSSSSSAEATVQSTNNKTNTKDVGNGLLEEVGQYSTKDGSKTTLEAIAKTSDSNEIVEGVTVENITVKIMSVTDIDEDYSDIYSNMGIYDGDYMIQVTYDMKNETPYTLQSISTPVLITSSGEQITFNNILGDYELLSGGTTYQSGAIGKINNPEIEELTINWDITQEDDEMTNLETEAVNIKF